MFQNGDEPERDFQAELDRVHEEIGDLLRESSENDADTFKAKLQADIKGAHESRRNEEKKRRPKTGKSRANDRKKREESSRDTASRMDTKVADMEAGLMQRHEDNTKRRVDGLWERIKATDFSPEEKLEMREELDEYHKMEVENLFSFYSVYFIICCSWIT